MTSAPVLLKFPLRLNSCFLAFVCVAVLQCGSVLRASGQGSPVQVPAAQGSVTPASPAAQSTAAADSDTDAEPEKGPTPVLRPRVPAAQPAPPASMRPVFPQPAVVLPARPATGDMEIAAVPRTEEAGELLMLRGRYLAAIHVFQELEPKSATVYNKTGVAHEHMQMMAEARNDFEQALRLDPHYAEAYNNLGTLAHTQGDLRRAESLYKKSIHLKPKNADAYQNLSALYYARGKFHKGDVALRRAILLDRDVLERTARNAIPAHDAAALTEIYFRQARNCALAGNSRLALDYLHKAVGSGFHDRKRTENEEAFTTLRNTEEFRLLVADMHVR